MSNELEQLKDFNPLPNDSIQMPAFHLPAYRTSVAVRRGVEKNILFTTWGGLGDQICAEPTLRFALDTFKGGVKISLASESPDLFRHLQFHEVFDLRHQKVDESKYLKLDTMTTPDSLSWQFISHMVTNCVDCPSLNALRCQVPISYKKLRLEPLDPEYTKSSEAKVLHGIASNKNNHVVIHAGKHWESKTYPKDWWDAVYDSVTEAGLIPVLIGKDVSPDVGVVDVKHDPKRGIDLRNRCTVNETVWLCKNAQMMICSDSSPLHMAASGEAHIAFIATAKHPDFVTHWREGGWSWRMKNFSKGGLWDVTDYCPNKASDVNADKCPEDVLRGWLPDPKEMTQWLLSTRNS